MKKPTLILMAALLAASTTANAGWWRTYGGEGSEGGYCVQITSDSNYIISGSRDDSLWILKVDTSGNVLWSKTYIGEGSWRGRWIEETLDGGFIVAAHDLSLIKTDALGDILWTKDLDMYSYCVLQTSDDGYIVVGGDRGGERDYYLILVKTNSAGDTIWTLTHKEPTAEFNLGVFVQETSDSGYIVTGMIGIPSGEEYSGGLWLMKVNATGEVMWTKMYGEENNMELSMGRCVRQTSDGGYIITGNRNSVQRGLWLLKTDAYGDTLWTKTFSTAYGGVGYCVQETTDNGYIVVGATEEPVAYLTPTGRDLWLLKTDTQGDTFWTRIYGDGGYDLGRCVLQTEDNGYLITGSTSSYGLGGSFDLWLLKTDSLGLLGIKEDPKPETSSNWRLINSIGRQIFLCYENRPQGLHATVFDATGRKIDELQSHCTSGTLLWGANEPAGVYFIQVKEVQLTSTAKVVLVR